MINNFTVPSVDFILLNFKQQCNDAHTQQYNYTKHCVYCNTVSIIHLTIYVNNQKK